MKLKIFCLLFGLSISANVYTAWNFLSKTVYANGILEGQQQAANAITSEIEKQLQTGQLILNVGGKATIFVQKK